MGVKMPIAGHEAPAVDGPFALQRRRPPTCFLDEDLESGGVPRIRNRIDRNLASSLGNQAMLPEVAESPLSASGSAQAEHTLGRGGSLGPVEAAVEELGIRRMGDPRDPQATDAPIGPVSSRGPPALSHRGCAYQSGDDLSLSFNGEECCEHRDSAHEVIGGINGIDDEARFTDPCNLPVLFAKHSEMWMVLPREQPGPFLDGEVRLGHRAQVGFCRYVETRAPKVTKGDRVRLVGNFLQESKPADWFHREGMVAGCGPGAPNAHRCRASETES